MNEKYILLVEDNPDDERLTLRALEKGRVSNSVIVVRDGVEALDFVFSQGAYANRTPKSLPQVILLDLKLPKLDGIGVLKRIRAENSTRHLPVVILTSSAEESDILAGITEGANSYVVKPVDMAQFNEAVKQLGMYWYVLNQTQSVRSGG